MTTKIYEHSSNYTCQVIRLPHKRPVTGLDKLVEVSHQGNSCLVSKDADPGLLYLFFPSECVISKAFLNANNLYRHTDLNLDQRKAGFFEDNGRVRAIKFKGVISSGFIVELSSLLTLGIDISNLKVGDEFNEIAGIEICRKYVKPSVSRIGNKSSNEGRVLDSIINSKQAPEHPDTAQLLRNVHKLNLNTYVAITYKLHGTSVRIYNTRINRKLSIWERWAKWLGIQVQQTEFAYVTASRRVVKSINFETLAGKEHFFSEDLWSKVAKEFLDGKLNKGEAVYGEVIGCDYGGKAIQGGYSYGLTKPKLYIYRIANINDQGIEVDLSYHQMIKRAEELGVPTCPEFFYGTIREFLQQQGRYDGNYDDDRNLGDTLEDIFYNNLLEKPSILDKSVVEEGFVFQFSDYPKTVAFKIKSKKFLEHETKMADKGDENIEDQQNAEIPDGIASFQVEGILS